MAPADDIAHADHERRLRRLLRRLPGRMQATTRWLRKPASRWARVPAGVLLIIGGFLAILPFFGLWMLPLGLMLLADDIPPLRRLRACALRWLERRRPHWFAAAGRQRQAPASGAGLRAGSPPRRARGPAAPGERVEASRLAERRALVKGESRRN